MTAYYPDFSEFEKLAGDTSTNTIPMYRRLMSDQLTPVLGYRRLVHGDERMAPSFLFESVEDGSRQGRYSYCGAQPIAQLIAHDHNVRHVDFLTGKHTDYHSDDPLREMARITSKIKLADVSGLSAFSGGWVGFAGYDTVRYLEGEKLSSPPPDDRGLPDLQMQLYREIVAFDHVQKTVLVITHVDPSEHGSLREAYDAGGARLDAMATRLETPVPRLANGLELPAGDVDLGTPPPTLPTSSLGDGGYQRVVEHVKEYIRAGDIFQVVPSQRFEVHTQADPFDIYRALRVVNPSPYMFYLQIEGAMLVGSSPEILVRVNNRHVTNRPLAGTRKRGATPDEDRALEIELLADPKDRAEHIMLVDLGRNDVGRIATPGTVNLPAVLEIERYSHVMHISSTVTGQLRDDCDCWDALRTSLPVGTVSGAPKVRAMQIIDEVEKTRRGPYAGAVGYVDYDGNMDMAIALRTMVVMPAGNAANQAAEQTANSAGEKVGGGIAGGNVGGGWVVHIQAGGGIVADSVPDDEHQETVNKAAALAKAIDVAEKAFPPTPPHFPPRE